MSGSQGRVVYLSVLPHGDSNDAGRPWAATVSKGATTVQLLLGGVPTYSAATVTTRSSPCAPRPAKRDVVFHRYRHAIATFIDSRPGGGRAVTRGVLGHTGRK